MAHITFNDYHVRPHTTLAAYKCSLSLPGKVRSWAFRIYGPHARSRLLVLKRFETSEGDCLICMPFCDANQGYAFRSAVISFGVLLSSLLKSQLSNPCDGTKRCAICLVPDFADDDFCTTEAKGGKH